MFDLKRTYGDDSKERQVAAGEEIGEEGMILRGILEKDPHNVDANHLMGIIAGERGDYELAARHISEAINQDSGRPMCHFNLGLAMLGAGHRDKALAAFEQAIRLAPNFVAMSGFHSQWCAPDHWAPQ